MTESKRAHPMVEKLQLLIQTDRCTPMGRLLRQFWHPVAVAAEIAPGTAKPIRIMGEDLTLYRGESGRPYLVAGRCAHRLTLLHTGWVEGEKIRCMYHGWQYEGTGQCVERPAEDDKRSPDIKIESYPVRDYAGLVFAFMGEGQPPEFDLPRKNVLERSDYVRLPRTQIWPCNWFQQIENSMDAVHVSFVHQWGRVGNFGRAVSARIPRLEYVETDAGIRQIATRGEGNVRISDWTFPNNNHIVVPGHNAEDPWIENAVWMVPVDDETALRIQVRAVPSRGDEADRHFLEHFNKHRDYNPADHHDDLFRERKVPDDPVYELTTAQDYVAQMGQGTIADRTQERLATSDRGIVLLRKIFWRELEAIGVGLPPKEWRRLPEAVELPRQKAYAAQAD